MNLNSRKTIVTAALYVATFLAAIEGTIVSTAMPTITMELKGIHLFSWVNTVYLLAMVISTPLFGKLSDLYGRKKLMILGIIIFLIGSMLSGISTNMIQLIVFRAIQGLGAGSLLTLPIAIIADLYDFDKRAKVQGWLASIWGIAGITGPLVGGLLVDFISWRAIFYMNLPFGLIALYLLIAYMKEQLKLKKPIIDYIGMIVFSISILCLLLGMNSFENGFELTGKTMIYLLLMIASIFGLVWFVAIEKKAKEPFMPLSLFQNKVLVTAFSGCFILALINVSIVFYIPLWIQGLRGESATVSGMLMIPLSITWPLGSILAGNFISKFGLHRIGIVGSIFLMAGNFGLATIDSSTAMGWIMLYVASCGLSFGLLFTSLTITVTTVASENVRGTASSTMNLLRSLGQAVGLALFGIVIFSNDADPQYLMKLESSLHLVFILVAILSILILGLAYRLFIQRNVVLSYAKNNNR